MRAKGTEITRGGQQVPASIQMQRMRLSIQRVEGDAGKIKIAARKSGVDLLPGGKRQPSVSDSGAFCAPVYTLHCLVYASYFLAYFAKTLGVRIRNQEAGQIALADAAG